MEGLKLQVELEYLSFELVHQNSSFFWRRFHDLSDGAVDIESLVIIFETSLFRPYPAYHYQNRHHSFHTLFIPKFRYLFVTSKASLISSMW